MIQHCGDNAIRESRDHGSNYAVFQMFAKMQAMMAEMDSLKSGKKDSSTGMAPSKQSGVPPRDRFLAEKRNIMESFGEMKVVFY